MSRASCWRSPRPVGGACEPDAGRASRLGGDGRDHPRPAQMAAALAGHAGCSRRRGPGNGTPEPAGADNRYEVRRHSLDLAGAQPAGPVARQGHGGSARRNLLHASGRHRVASLRGGCRRHDRASAPLELRACRAGRGQSRIGALRRFLRLWHHRADRNQCALGCAWSGLGHAARAVHPALHGCGRAACRLHSACRSCGCPRRRRLEHDREAGHRHSRPVRLGRGDGPRRHILPDDLPRPDRSHRRRLRARLGPLYPTDEQDHRHLHPYPPCRTGRGGRRTPARQL